MLPFNFIIRVYSPFTDIEISTLADYYMIRTENKLLVKFPIMYSEGRPNFRSVELVNFTPVQLIVHNFIFYQLSDTNNSRHFAPCFSKPIAKPFFKYINF